MGGDSGRLISSNWHPVKLNRMSISAFRIFFLVLRFIQTLMLRRVIRIRQLFKWRCALNWNDRDALAVDFDPDVLDADKPCISFEFFWKLEDALC